MNKEQAIELFEGLIKDSEQAKKVWGLGETGYYTSEALISAYNLAISVVKVMDVEEEPKRWVVRAVNKKYFISLAYGSGIVSLAECSAKTKEGAYPFTDKSKAEAVATLVDGSVEEV